MVTFENLTDFLNKYSGNRNFNLEEFLETASYELGSEFAEWKTWNTGSVQNKATYLKTVLNHGIMTVSESGKDIDNTLNFIFDIKSLRFVLTTFLYVLCEMDMCDSDIPYGIILRFEDSDDEEIFSLYKSNIFKMLKSKTNIKLIKTENVNAVNH